MDKETVLLLRELSDAYRALIDRCMDENDADGALDVLQKALPRQEALAAATGDGDDAARELLLRVDLGFLYEIKQNRAEALRQYNAVLARTENASLPLDALRARATALVNLGHLSDENDEADGMFRSAVQLWESICAQTDNDEDRRNLVYAYDDAAQRRFSAEDPSGEADYARQGLRALEPRLKRGRAPEDLRLAALFNQRLAHCVEDDGEAEEYFRRTLDLRRETAKATGEPEDMEEWADALIDLGAFKEDGMLLRQADRILAAAALQDPGEQRYAEKRGEIKDLLKEFC